MSAFDDLKARYFVVGSGGGSFSSGSSGLPEYSGCDVIPHIGGPDYFRALKSAIDRADVTYIYIAGWWLDTNCDVVPGTKLVNLLKARSAAGVDVRILGWVMPPDVLNNPVVASGRVPLADMLRVNENTMRFVAAARAEPKLADKAMLNVLSHPAGAVHTKLALVGGPSGDVGFTGGIDPQQGRNTPGWHDVEAEVRGPAVQPMYDWFQAMWNENQGRSPVTVQANGFSLATRTAGAPSLAARTIAAGSPGTKHVQSGRTVPRMNFSTLGGIGASLAGVSLPQNQPISWAPTGLAEIRQLWQKGISGAQRYIYIEDQAFTSTEIFDWLNSALKTQPGPQGGPAHRRRRPHRAQPGPDVGRHAQGGQRAPAGGDQRCRYRRPGRLLHAQDQGDPHEVDDRRRQLGAHRLGEHDAAQPLHGHGTFDRLHGRGRHRGRRLPFGAVVRASRLTGAERPERGPRAVVRDPVRGGAGQPVH